MASRHITTPEGNPLYIHDWADGPKLLRAPRRVKTDDEVQCEALWLERHGKKEEAEDILERHCSRRPCVA
ncbi:MAG: hypothetical protein JWO43_489 [Candidatus Adlerbacteria bacterium]|nr:hypothetical protein [Candidatus Adlerbacteria bacterium]